LNTPESLETFSLRVEASLYERVGG
jgi:hypothetical protein